MIIGCVLAETSSEETANQCNFLHKYAATNGFKLEIIYKGMSIEELCRNILNPQDILIIYDKGCLGNSLSSIRDILHLLAEKSIKLCCAAEDYIFQPKSGDWLAGFDMAVGLRGQIASRRTAEALSERKAKGIKLGTKKGASLKKKLDGKESIIRRLLAKGMPKTKIARELGVSIVTLYNFIKDKSLEVENA